MSPQATGLIPRGGLTVAGQRRTLTGLRWRRHHPERGSGPGQPRANSTTPSNLITCAAIDLTCDHAGMHLVTAEHAAHRIIDGESVCAAIAGLGDPTVVASWARTFDLLADPTRLREC